MNKDTIYICFTQNKHTLPLEIIENLKRLYKDVEVIDSKVERFKNGEQKAVILTSVRRKDIWLISTAEENVDIEVVKTLLYLDALQRAGANRIQLIMPLFYYARQDQTNNDREPISGALFAKFYESLGVGHFITVHLHNNAIQGFFKGQFDIIGTRKLFWNHLENYCRKNEGSFNPKEWLIIFPDEGAAKRCRDFFYKSNAGGYAGFSKHRSEANKVDKMDFFGDVKGMRCFLYDDLVDTGGTLAMAGELLIANGAKEVIAACSHALLTGEAPDILQKSSYSKVFVTNSLYIDEKKQFPKLEIVSLAPMLSEVIKKAHLGESIRYENW
jgi:ribose-phosphate pyrophosphokinase